MLIENFCLTGTYSLDSSLCEDKQSEKSIATPNLYEEEMLFGRDNQKAEPLPQELTKTQGKQRRDCLIE